MAKTQDQGALELPWDDARVFLAAYRTGSLGAAGHQLGLDTSTVSRRLTAFEQALGLRLFERGREGLVPSHHAERLFPAAEAIEAAQRRLGREARSARTQVPDDEPAGVVRLSVDPGVAKLFVVPLLARLRERLPHVTLDLDVSTRSVDLAHREAELAIRTIRPRGAELLVKKLGESRWVPAAAPSVVEGLGLVADWSHAPWIAWDDGDARFPPEHWRRQHTADAAVVLRTSDFPTQLSAAAAGLGVGIFPASFLGAAGLRPVRTKRSLASSVSLLPIGELWLVTSAAWRDVPRVAALWDFLQRELPARFG
jgi:DNA-binding transcriptional LysR family regulator